MKVHFRQSGGFAGLVKECQLDTEQLPPDEAARLKSLVEQSHLEGRTEDHSPRARDVFHYTITVEDGGSRRLSFDDRTVPPDVQPLVRFLKTHAAPGRR
jgi:hypothetical protein